MSYLSSKGLVISNFTFTFYHEHFKNNLKYLFVKFTTITYLFNLGVLFDLTITQIAKNRVILDRSLL